MIRIFNFNLSHRRCENAVLVLQKLAHTMQILASLALHQTYIILCHIIQ